MPVMKGCEKTKAIRRLGRPLSKMIPVFAVTANAFDEDVRNALESGKNVYAARSVDIAVLEQIVKLVLETQSNHILSI